MLQIRYCAHIIIYLIGMFYVTNSSASKHCEIDINK